MMTDGRMNKTQCKAMAKKLFDGEIDNRTDWGGDETTGGLPVSGRAVQKFIKKSLAALEEAGGAKFGYVRILGGKMLQMFPDRAGADLYDGDPTANEGLLLAQVQLPNTGATVATMKVAVTSAPAQHVAKGTGARLAFTYLSYYDDESDLSGVRGKATVWVNNSEKSALDLRSGGSYEVDLTRWLSEERNEVQLTVTNNEGSTRTFLYDVNVVDIGLSSDFDATLAYTGAIEVDYTPRGSILKTVHFEIDGEEAGTVETTANNRRQTYVMAAQAHGAHRLRLWMTASLQGSTIRSNTLCYDVVCVEQGNATPIIASAFEPGEVSQYETLEIPFVVHDPENNPASVALYVNGERVSERSVGRTQQAWTYRADRKGSLTLRIECGAASREFGLDVKESMVKSEAETEGLELYLTSLGRSNQDTDREEWKHGNVAAVFAGMNWVTNGWVADGRGGVCLRLSGGARAEIPFNMFAGNILQEGKTVEVEFAVSDVTDYNATVLSCLAGGIGLRLTPNMMSLRSEQSEVSVRYKEDERVRVAFVVGRLSGHRLMQAYVNGIKSRSVQYPSTDGLTQAAPAGITIEGKSATVDIYNIRCYSHGLTPRQLLDNYIADMDDIGRKVEVFGRNQVYDSYGGLSAAALNRQIPVMTIVGELPQYKGDKKTVRIEFSDLQKPERSFTAEGVTLNVQGTSSQYYPRKNYKWEARKGFTMAHDGSHADDFTLDGDEVLPARVFCMKADFAESSGTHNTGMADYVGWMLREAGMLTAPQRDDAKVRTTIYGEPCVVFHKADDNAIAEFIGKYNFNTDKGAEGTFGFSAGDESWEFLNNTGERPLFKSADFEGEGWKDDFEARYPDGGVDTDKMAEAFRWVVACKGDTEKFKRELEQHFDKRQIVFYYLITLVFGMVDQRAKNMFMTRYEGGGWLFIFYDNDTCLGVNNEGAMAFAYDIEIHDTIGTQAVWNGADSELWKLVEESLGDDIRKMYYDLRQRGLLSYGKAMEYLNERQGDRWGEAVYNEDGYFKYEQPLTEGYADWSTGREQQVRTGAYLYALQGSREAHRRWWLYNRFKYLDSKFQAGSSLSDYCTFRTYTPAQWQGVKPQADLTLRSFTAMYGTVRWGSVTRSERMGEGETKTIKAPDMTLNDTETIIYNASMIASIGDLSPLYVGTVDVSKATHITELIIGSGKEGYRNTNFTVLSVGTNHVLRKLDIRNCPNFTANIDVSGCEAIEEIYATGTGATAVNLAEGGAVRVMQLPATIANLTLKNQPHLTGEGLALDGVGSLVALTVEGTPGVDGYALAKSAMADGGKLRSLRLVGIDAKDADLSLLMAMMELGGTDEAGRPTERASISGRLHVDEAFEEWLTAAREALPGLEISYDRLKRTPRRTITVKGQDTMSGIEGATVTINGEAHTADGSGRVEVTGGGALSVEVAAEGYVGRTVAYAASTEDTRNTVMLDKVVTFAVTVNDQYGSALAGVAVDFDGERKETVADGTARFATSRGKYKYTVTYNGTEKSGDAVVEQADVSAAVVFDRAIEDYKPKPNGNIQMLLKRESEAKKDVTLEVSSPTAAYTIDWGDGETTAAAGTGKQSYTHEYADGMPHNVEVSGCEEVTACNVVLSDNKNNLTLFAYWTIGRSKVTGLRFGNSTDTYTNNKYACINLSYIGVDLFRNDVNRRDFNGCFENCRSLATIPQGVFDNCLNAYYFDYCFYKCEAITSIPSMLFAKCTNAYSFNGCFGSAIKLASIPSGLFDNCYKAVVFKDCFNYCKSLTLIPEGLFDACVDAFSFNGTFCNTGIASIPPGLFDSCGKANDVSNCFASCDNLTSIPTGLFDNCYKLVKLKNCFSNSGITKAFMPTYTSEREDEIGSMFYGCKNLAIMVAMQETPVYIQFYTFYDAGRNVPGGMKIYVPDASVEAYKKASNWRQYANRIYPMSELPEESQT